jgi:hypothetical protein
MPAREPSRRAFLGRLGEAGAAAALGAGVIATPELRAEAAQAARADDWDLAWIERVRRARHRAVFDAPGSGIILDLATRYLDNIQTAYGANAGEVCAVLNVRTRAISLGLSDAIWAKYPIAEDYKVDDPVTKAPARRNPDWRPVETPGVLTGNPGIERLQQRGAIVLVCDFALGHLSTRLATKVGATADAVHAELRRGLVPGAVLVPSGIFGACEAQNAGCAFFPS